MNAELAVSLAPPPLLAFHQFLMLAA